MSKLISPAGGVLGVALAILIFGTRLTAGDTIDRVLVIGIFAILVAQAIILAEIARWRRM